MNSARHLLSVLIWFPALAGILALFLPRQAPKLLRAYGVGAFPETFVLDAQGRAVAWFPGEVTAKGLREAIAKAGGS